MSLERTPLRRLTRLEYNNSVRDLLGDSSRPADAFVADQKVLGFNNNGYATAGITITREYVLAAETLARAAVSSNLENLVNCGAEPSNECISNFIRRIARRAFRAPVEDTHWTRLQTLYQDTSTRFGLAAGIEAILTSILSSPRFLYVLEYGAEPAAPLGSGYRSVSQYELAARLSFYFWRSVPDEELLEAAARGELTETFQLRAQAERMLHDPRATSAAQDFAEQWLELEGLEASTKDPSLGFSWTPDVARALRSESLLTYGNAVLSEGSTLAQLLLSPTSFINGELGEYYGVPVSNLVFGRRNVNPDPNRPVRVGLLGQGGVLARHAHATLASPVLRGKLVRDKFLCRPIPPPDSAIAGVIAPAPNSRVVGKTTRDLATAHVSLPGCASCHAALDPLGFAFGAFDAAGRAFPQNASAQFLESEQVVDQRGTFTATGGSLDGLPFDGSIELARQLAESDQVRSCFVLQQFRYALNRPEAQADACSLQQLRASFADGQIMQLMLAVVQTPAFSRLGAPGDCR